MAAIIAAVLFLTYPRLSVLAASYRLEGAARGLALELQKVRLRAIAEGRCFQVSFNASTRRYQIASKAGSTPCGTTGFATMEEPPRALDDASAIAVSATASPVFEPRGGASTSAVITLTAATQAVRLVAVNGAGRVNVQ